jgi:Tfp pilus assembly protein PilF
VELLRDLLADRQAPPPLSYASLSKEESLADLTEGLVSRRTLLYNLGAAYGAAGKIDSAIIYLEAAVDSDPRFAEAWVNLGSARFAKGEFAAARESFLRAVALGYQSPLVPYNVALTFLADGDTANARRHLERSLLLDSTFTPAVRLRRELRP